MEKVLAENFNLLVFLLLGIILLLVLSLVAVIIYLLVKDKKSSSPAVDPEVVGLETLDKRESKTNLESLKARQSSVFCENHSEAQGVGTCGICEKVFCDNCLKEYEHLRFCPEHFRTYTNHKWIDITNIKTTPTETENAVPVYQFKKEIWEQEDIPTFIETDYKINVEGDFVESYVKLYVREQDKDSLVTRIKELKVH